MMDRRGFIYVAGLALLFLVVIVSAMVVLSDKKGSLSYAVGADAVVLEQTAWDAESFVYYVGRSLWASQCDVLPSVLQEFSTRVAASQGVVSSSGAYDALQASFNKVVVPRLQERVSLHPSARPVSFDVVLDVDNGVVSAFADREMEFDAFKGKARVGVYRVSPDVSVPLAVSFSDLDAVVSVSRELRQKCDGKYPADAARRVCVESALPSGYAVSFPDDVTAVVSRDVVSKCGPSVQLSVPVQVRVAG